MQCEIGVVGNGAVGKAAALGFAQAGFKVILLCPSALPATSSGWEEWDTRVFALNHTATSLLRKLKVWDALALQRVAPIESIKVVDVDNDTNGKNSTLLLDAYTAHQHELAWIVEDQHLNQALNAALRFAPDITVVAGKTKAMSADFSALTLDNGVVLHAELWVGADGAQSWLRNQANIGVDYRSYQQRGVVANFSCAKPHHNVAHQWFIGEQGIIALLPLPEQQVSLVWSAPNALATVLLAENTHQLAQRLIHYCQDELGELKPLSQHAQSFPLQLIHPHTVIGPRLALIGDAAHVIHPLAGHGLNLGFADVTTLLETVTQRESWRGVGDERVLQRYARARKEDVMLMQFVTDSLAHLFCSPFAPIKKARHTGLNWADKWPFLKKKLMQHAMGK